MFSSGQSTDDDEYDSVANGGKTNGKAVSSDEEGERESGDKEILANNMTWKDNLAEKARAAYLDRQSNSGNLMKIVYGVFAEVFIFKQRNRQILIKSLLIVIIFITEKSAEGGK